MGTRLISGGDLEIKGFFFPFSIIFDLIISYLHVYNKIGLCRYYQKHLSLAV